MARQNQRERLQIKSLLSQHFDRWNAMTDDELMAEAKKSFPALSGTPNRGQLLKYLVMNHLQNIN